MITRIFRVEIHPELRDEFEAKFRSLSVGAVDSQPGCLSVVIGFPVSATPNEYSMISIWESLDKLIDFLGEDWNQAFIPDGMDRFAKHYSVHHYQSIE